MTNMATAAKTKLCLLINFLFQTGSADKTNAKMELIADEYLSGGESTGLRDLSAIPTSLKTLMRLISH